MKGKGVRISPRTGNPVREYHRRKDIAFIDGKPHAKLSPEAYVGLDATAKASPQPAEDPWVHRSAGMRCRTCMFYVKKETTSSPDPEKGPIGRCRRHAPTMNGYPVVFVTDWCGDHKLDENKGA